MFSGESCPLMNFPALSGRALRLVLGVLTFVIATTLSAQDSGETAPEPPPYDSWLPQDENPRGTGVPFKGILLLDSRGATYRDPLRTNRLNEEIARSPFTHVAIQVRAFGDAYYESEIVPKALGVSDTFDPLARVLEGIKNGRHPKKVYAWLELYRVANVNRAIPLPPGHVLKRHPEWLSRNSRFQTEDAEGNQYLEPGLDEVQQYLEAIVTELMTNYPLDGVVLDGLRYPGLGGDWGYHPRLLDLWRKETGQSDAPAPDDPTWQKLRRRLLDRNLNRLRISAENARDGATAMVIASSQGPAPDSVEEFEAGPVYDGALQDWPQWMEEGFADAVILMNYRQEGPDSDSFDQWNLFAAELARDTGTDIYPAVAGFANISIDTLSQMRRIQDLGLPGAALSNYLEPVRDAASRELFFRALAKTVFGPDSERLTYLPEEEEATPEPEPGATEIAGLLPEDGEMEMELPPPPELEPFESDMELTPLDEEPPYDREEPQVASLLDEASERLAPQRDDNLIEPPFQAMEFLRRKYPNIF